MATRELTVDGAPVLMYHGIADTPPADASERDRKYWVSPASFRRHLVQVRLVGHRVVPLDGLWTGRCPVDSSVVLTFDDGRASDYEAAFPLLARSGATATFFVNTATIGQAGHLAWSQIAEMQRAGMSFQSHSHEHVILLGLPARLLDHQLRTSKQLLEDRVGQPVEFLAAPYGLLDRRVVTGALEAGYRAVCTSWNWPARPGSHTVSRAVVYRDTSEERFADMLLHRPWGYLPEAARSALGFVPKRVMLKLRPERLGARHDVGTA